jgi:signal transduction histidine kinase
VTRAARGRRRSLQLRLFAWSGATILVTGLVAFLAAWVVSTRPNAWQRTQEGAVAIASRRFAEVWEEPTARRALAAEVASELDVGVALYDVRGEPLERFGSIGGRPFVTVPVARAGVPQGRVDVFVRRFRGHGAILLPLAGSLAVLWGLSGLLARRLARPLADLASTADAIGRGDLDRRTRVTRHAPAEVARVAEALDDMAARIQRQMVDQRELLAAVSHEVRSPLARIRLLVEMARPATEAERERALGEIDREVEEIDALVGSLLASSRLDFGTIDARPLDPVRAARDAILRAGLDEGIVQPDDGLEAVLADPTLVSRALANLLDNARHHGGGVVSVEVRRGTIPGEIVFSVHDDGPGLGDDTERAFQAFHRKPGTHGALGLGLAIVARIAEAHGGRAFAEDRSGGGATVGFSIVGRAPDDDGPETPVASAR